MDLGADQCTMLYVAGQFDVCSGTQISSFPQGGAARILPNGDLLVSGGDFILLEDSSGGLLRTYDIGCNRGLSINPDGKSFWTFASGKVDFETGNVLEFYKELHTPDGLYLCDAFVGEVAVFGELRAATPVYDLGLFEDASPSDSVLDLNQEVQSVAETSNLNLESATIRWINPFGESVRSEIVPLSLSGQKATASDKFSPDQVGRWTVEADFGNGEVIQKTLDISFNVIPESPIGIIAMIGSSFVALVGFVYFRNRSHQ